MNISLAPEKIFTLFGTQITNSIIASWAVLAIILIIGLIVRFGLKEIPNRVQALFELLFGGLYNLAKSIIGREDVARELFPFIATLFIFIIFSSWMGLIPGVSSVGFKEWHNGSMEIIPLLRAPTTDLNMTIALALVSVAYVQYLGIKYAGVFPYLKKFFNFSNPIGFIVGILEFISELTRVISYSFRLFGNIFAGEVLIGVMIFLTISLVPFFPPLPILFFILETAVALIQAFVFCFLTIIFTSLAIVAHDSSGHSHGGEELELSVEAASAEDRLLNHPQTS